MRRFILVCSAATKSQRSARFPTADEPADLGHQVRREQFSFRTPDRIYCAPEQRAKDTARLFGDQLILESALRDCDFGKWQGRSLGEIQEGDPTGTLSWLSEANATPHGGESIEEVQRRAAHWLGANSNPGLSLVITHAPVIRAIILHILQAPFSAFWRVDVEPLCALDMRSNGQRWSIRSLNNGQP